jgi:hypothetical protein
MANETDVANIALTLLGQDPIISINDETSRAVIAKRRLPDVRDSVLELPPAWNFATTRVTLTAILATTPAWGMTNAYALPADFIALTTTRDQTSDFRLEYTAADGRILVTNLSPVDLMYVARVETVSLWPPSFVDAVATKLAAEMAIKVTRNINLMKVMYDLFQVKLDEARLSDALQAPIEQVTGTHLLTARLVPDWPSNRPISNLVP